VFIWLALISRLPVAYGDLAASNFTATHPLTVMAVGDSITDDCMANGAWRKYLELLLETNGYAFTFVGRQSSTPSANFTKVRHEGYCGAVVAPPGVLTSSVHGYPGADVYLQGIVRDALTNATPDLLLVLIGANDIGRARDPWLTATNDMPNLLDLIFSNAPNANVILAKITVMDNANVNGMNYGSNFLRVPIYNAALQGMVNQRQAAGQKVFLADMFSVVDYATMFDSDHLHPNALGLQAIAGEWLARIQSITSGGSTVVSELVKGGDNWKYCDTGLDLGTNWVQSNYDDGGWSNGPARLGYGDQESATKVSYGPQATNKFPTIYFRHAFTVPANVTFTNLVLRLAQDHGSVVWLNGQELWRTNLPAGPIAYTNLALTAPGSFDSPYLFNKVSVDATKLAPGTNVLAVELHQLNANNPVAGFDLELIGTGTSAAPPTLSFATAGTNLVFGWSVDNGSGFGLYVNSNLSTPDWTSAASIPQTNNGQLVVTQGMAGGTKFFRLQKP
jgi:lysophospholipase L1-like esterase